MLEELLAKLFGGQGGPMPTPSDRQLMPSELGVPPGGLMALLGGSQGPQQPQQQAQPQPQQTQELSAQSRQSPPVGGAPSLGGGGINFGDMLGRLGPALMMMSGDPNYTRSGAVMAAQNSKNRQTAQEQQQAQQKMTQTYQWLTGARGMDPQQAAIIAQDPTALREYLKPKDPKEPKLETIQTPNGPRSVWVNPDKTLAPVQAPGAPEQPQTDVKVVNTIRKEFDELPSSKNIAQARPIYQAMVDAAPRNTRAADLNIVYGIGKIFDPNSVVREGEMILVKDASQLPPQILNLISRINGGAALSQGERQALMAEAHGRMKAYEAEHAKSAERFTGISQRFGIRPEDVVTNYEPTQAWKMPEAPVTTQGASPGAQPLSRGPKPDADGWISFGNGIRVREKK
jgi:hypothetical protein